MTWTDPHDGDADVTPLLATCTFRGYDPAMGVPVRTTVGSPRWVRYPMEQSKLVTPYGVFGKTEDPAEYQRLYLARLTDHGAGTVSEELAAIRARHDGRRLVILCFCDVTRPDGWCHRRMWAEWFQEFIGQAIPELTLPPGADPHPAVPTGLPACEPSPQGALFDHDHRPLIVDDPPPPPAKPSGVQQGAVTRKGRGR